MILRAGRRRLSEAASAFSSTWGNADLRRAQLSFLGAWTAEWAFTVALGIVAYDAGGALAVGLVGLIRMLPAAVVTPLLAPYADRGRRERVLIVVAGVRGLATASIALIVAFSGPIAAVYALAVVSTIAATLFRPAHSALLPTLCRTGQELAGANVVRGFLAATATLIGPLAAAVLLAFANVAAVFAAAAAASFWAALILLRMRYDAPPREAPQRHPHLLAEAVDGIRAVLHSRDLRLIVGLLSAQTFTRGALTVFSVVVSIRLIGMGQYGAGALMAAVGVGAVTGSLVSSFLVRMWRLGAWFALGVALWGLPLALIGVFPERAAAFALLAALGLGTALVDIAGFTLVGRLAPDAVMGRVFGLLESIIAVSVGVGSIVASALIEGFGVRVALVAIGLVCPVLALAAWWRLRHIDRSVDALEGRIGLLQGVPMFDPLPLPSIEQLARGLEPVEVAAGGEVFAQGDIGDRYYVIESGEADVLGDGRVVATLGPGEGFGEIALLRRVRRTATVTARTGLRLQALDSRRFTAVVLGYTPSAQAAAAEVDVVLDRFAPNTPFDDEPV